MAYMTIYKRRLRKILPEGFQNYINESVASRSVAGYIPGMETIERVMQQLELFGKPTTLILHEAVPIYWELEGKLLRGKSHWSDCKQIMDILGKKYLHELSVYDVQTFRHTRRLDNPDVKESSINRGHTRLTRIINAFKEWQRIGKVGAYDFSELKLPLDNPGELEPKYPEDEFRRNRVVTPEEFRRFCDYAHPEIRKICTIAVLTLLRKKDIRLLANDNLNKALDYISGTQSKTKKPYNIPITFSVKVHFGKKEHQYVVDFTNFRRRFTRAKIDSDVDFQFRDLRRSGATQLLLEGIDIRTIQILLGHQDLSMTEKYLNPPKQIGREAARKLEKSFVTNVEEVGFTFNAN